MTYFNEENTVEQLVLDTFSDKDNRWCVAEPQADYLDSHLTLQILSLKWRFAPASPSTPTNPTGTRALADLRKAAGLNQSAVAKAMGLNQAYISQMETGK